MQLQDILIKPIISEKSLKDAGLGKYTFLVNQKANKTEIKKAIEAVFDVKVIEIKTNITKGTTVKNTRIGRKFTKFSDKKARVTLTKGQSIAIFDEHLGKDDKKKSKEKKEEKKSSSAKVTEGQAKVGKEKNS